MFQKYCDDTGVCSLPATSYTVACYLKWLGERGTVQKKSLKPYLSVINTVHKDLGYRQRPAIGSLVKSMKRAYGRKVVRIRPAPRILVMPARIILDMWRRVEELTALPDLEYITKLPEIRALLACIVCYITGSRPSSIALLPLTGVAFALCQVAPVTARCHPELNKEHQATRNTSSTMSRTCIHHTKTHLTTTP
ncbi:hypothetical protein RI054_05g29120 [Pseudoscourfieldia marina]